MTTDELVIAYAENRITMRGVKNEIHCLMYPTNDDGEYIFGIPEEDTLQGKMTSVRNDFYDPGDEYCYPQWPDGGWTEVLNDYDIEDHEMLLLGALWDRRKSLVAEIGNIRRAIAARGRKLIKEAKQN